MAIINDNTISMQKYQDLLVLGEKFSSLGMKDIAKKIFKIYIDKVSDYNGIPITTLFNAYPIENVDNYEEAINKALVLENLKKLHNAINFHESNWREGDNKSRIKDGKLLKFFEWLSEPKNLSNASLIIIKQTKELLDSRCGFDIELDYPDKTLSEMFIICLRGIFHSSFYSLGN